MMKKDGFYIEMRRFAKLLAWFALPFAALLLFYVCADPFKVVWNYESYYPQQVAGGVSLNPAHVATQNFLLHNPAEGYDSFILGNSRSIYYPIAAWQRHLPEGSRCYHYDAANESLKGLWQKLQFIASHGRKEGALRNVLMVVDAGLLEKVECDHWHLCETPPALTGYRNLVPFHWYNLKTFITPTFLLAYVDYSLFHRLRPYMLRKSLMTEDMFVYDARCNECDFVPLEQEIAEGTYYTEQRKRVFEGVQFPDSVSPVVIGARQYELLDSIRAILARHGTSTQIVVSPLYNQIRLNPADLRCLEQLFGADHVTDFSGPNAWNSDFHNYYEASHYRPSVAIAVLDSVYRKNSWCKIWRIRE